uniref:Uncharacterized protein n=1 Tax=Onchocerca volvulus TaxID=6282 RepID=A0A8R1TLN0_ONCVO
MLLDIVTSPRRAPIFFVVNFSQLWRVMSTNSQISPVSLGDLIVALVDQLPEIFGTELIWIALNCVDLRSLVLNWCVEFA